MNFFTYALIITSITVSSLFMSSASAQQCDINFNYGVVINPSHVRILQESQTSVQINHDQQLFIGGREIDLDEQQDIAAQYRISSVPTMIIEENGFEVDRFIGALPKKQVIEKLID